MKLWRAIPNLPLLRKELVEQAMRKRTYVVRTAYALTLFLFCGIYLYGEFDRYRASAHLMLGRGRDMFLILVMIQMAGIYLFLPAMMAGVITQEKQRNALVLLMVTDLRPWEIVLQKLGARLVPMFSFLLLSLPLLAIAYAFGGVTADTVWSAILVAFIACLQVGACAIMWSAFCQSTASAYLLTYVMLAALYFGPICAYVTLRGLRAMRWFRGIEESLLGMCPPFVLGDSLQGNQSVGDIALKCIPLVITILIFLIAARHFLVRRAMTPPRNLLRAMFRWLDRLFQRMNAITGGVVLVKERSEISDQRPVAWRELHSRAMGQFRYLVRLLVVLEVPVFIVCAAVIMAGRTYGTSEELSVLVFLLWPIAALLLSVQAVSAFVAERSRQTLDVLLTTPLSGRQIVVEKMAPLRRLSLVLAIPLLTVMCVEAWWESSTGGLGRYRDESTVHFVACFGLTLLIYVPLTVWLSAWIGLRSRSPARAIITAVSTMVVWCVGPITLMILLAETFRWSFAREPSVLLCLLSPALIVPFNEFSQMGRLSRPVWLAIAVNFAWYGAIAAFIRWWCLRNADRLLGRVAEEVGQEQS